MKNIGEFTVVITKKESNNLLTIMGFIKSEQYKDEYIVSYRFNEDTMEKKIEKIQNMGSMIKFYSSENLEEGLKEYLDDTWIDLDKDKEKYGKEEFEYDLNILDYWDKILYLVSKRLGNKVGHIDYRKYNENKIEKDLD